MKNKIIKIIAISISALFFAAPAFAGTVAKFSPSSVNAIVGQTFTVVVSVDPAGVQNFAEKLELDFPADLLKVESFTFASTWMQLTQSDYDLTDNTNGVLIKSAGYPNGFSASTVFGTVTFSVKKAGTGSIKVGSNSLAFDANNQTAITGGPVSVAVSSNVSLPKATPEPIAATTVKASVKTDTSVKTTVSTTSSVVEVAPTGSTSDQTAQASSSGSNLSWLWYVLGAAILGGIIYYFIRKD